MLFVIKNLSSAPAIHRGVGRIVGAAAVAVALVGALTATGGKANADHYAPIPSAGCGTTPAAAGQSTLEFAAADRRGRYIQDVPPGANRPTPLVLDLHGYLEPAVLERLSSGLGEFGATHGFITVTPELEEPGLPRWDFGPGAGDIAFLSKLLTHVEATQCIDERRVYASGLSMGAFTTSSLACQLSDRIAAIAPVAGLQDFGWCHPTRPVPVIAFHGTGDPIIAYTGGVGPNARFLPSPDGTGSVVEQKNGPAVGGPGPHSISDNAAAWARRNGCATAPAHVQVAPDVDETRYNCPATGAVELYSMEGAGHTWPGSSFPMPVPLTGTTATSISATSIIWDFFQAHPMPN